MKYCVVLGFILGLCACEGVAQGRRRNSPWAVNIWSAAFSPDGKRVAIGYSYGDKGIPLKKLIKIWDVSKGNELVSMEGHSQGVLFVSFSPDGSRLVSAGRDGKLNVYAAENGQLLRSILAHRPFIICAALSFDGNHALTVGTERDGEIETLKGWNLTTGKQVQRVRVPLAYRGYPALCPNNKLAFYGTQARASRRGENRLQLFNLKTGKKIKRFKAREGWGGPVAVSPNGKFVRITAYQDATGQQSVSQVVLCKVANRKVVWRSASDGQAGGFTRDGKRVFGWKERNSLSFWQLASGKKIKEVLLDPGKPSPTGDMGRAVARAVSPNGKYALTAIGTNDDVYGTDIRVRIWDVEKGKIAYEWKDPTSPMEG
jgi:WD40 repeat protein